jgi:hypothetical protein
MVFFLNLRNLARLPFCYFSFSFLLSLSSSHPHNTSLHRHHNHTQLQLLPSPHHSIFYPHHRNLHTTPNPLTTMDMYGYPQFPQATAPVEQYPAEEFAFLNYALPSLQQMAQSSAPVPNWGSYYQGGQYDLPQAAPVAWSTEQVVQPTASVPRGNYGYQGGQYAPLPTTPSGRRNTRRSSTKTPGMIRRTPGAISPAGIPSAAVPWHGTAPPMPTPQEHRPVAHQPQQQRPARRPVPKGLRNGHVHDHPELIDWQDQIVLHTLCEYSNSKGRHGESCANVGAPATEMAIRKYQSGNTKGAKESFHRLASKNLNQSINRERRRLALAAEAAMRGT